MLQLQAKSFATVLHLNLLQCACKSRANTIASGSTSVAFPIEHTIHAHQRVVVRAGQRVNHRPHPTLSVLAITLPNTIGLEEHLRPSTHERKVLNTPKRVENTPKRAIEHIPKRVIEYTEESRKYTKESLNTPKRAVECSKESQCERHRHHGNHRHRAPSMTAGRTCPTTHTPDGVEQVQHAHTACNVGGSSGSGSSMKNSWSRAATSCTLYFCAAAPTRTLVVPPSRLKTSLSSSMLS